MIDDTLIVGVGSSHGDDQFGWLVAEQLAARAILRIVVRRRLSPADISDWLEAPAG